MKQFKILLFLSFVTALMFVSCSEHIVSECEPDEKGEPPMGASFAEIQEQVFTTSCATSGCHGGTFHNSPNLEAGQSFDNIVNVKSKNNSIEYIKPGDSKGSLIIKRMTSTDGFTKMPPTGSIDQAIIDSIAVWIDNGAENN